MCRSMVDIQSAIAKIRWGIKKEDRRKKPQGKNIMSASATQGSHKKTENCQTLRLTGCEKVARWSLHLMYHRRHHQADLQLHQNNNSSLLGVYKGCTAHRLQAGLRLGINLSKWVGWGTCGDVSGLGLKVWVHCHSVASSSVLLHIIISLSVMLQLVKLLLLTRSEVHGVILLHEIFEEKESCGTEVHIPPMGPQTGTATHNQA